jgi:hypothetical protein
VSVFVDASHLGLLVTMVGVAAISGWVLTKSIEEENSGSAWTWGRVFGVTSLVAAWTFGRLETVSEEEFSETRLLLVARKYRTVVVGRALHNTLQAEPRRFHSGPGLPKGHTHLCRRTTGFVQHWGLFSG